MPGAPWGRYLRGLFCGGGSTAVESKSPRPEPAFALEAQAGPSVAPAAQPADPPQREAPATQPADPPRPQACAPGLVNEGDVGAADEKPANTAPDDEPAAAAAASAGKDQAEGQEAGAGEAVVQQGDECPICLTAMEERACYTTQCGHRFHHCCIAHWQRSGSENAATCPLCRSSITMQSVKELIWRATTFELASDEDIQANLDELKRIVEEVDERNRNLAGKEVYDRDGNQIEYFITGRIRTLYQSHQSFYFIVFALKDRIYEASVDTSESMAYYMRLKVRLSPTIEFKIDYIDH